MIHNNDNNQMYEYEYIIAQEKKHFSLCGVVFLLNQIEVVQFEIRVD